MTAFEAARHAIEALATQTHGSVESALRQVAEGKASVHVHTTIRQVTTQNKSVRSLEDLPADIRAEVEKVLANGEDTVSVQIAGPATPAAPPQAAPAEPRNVCHGCGYHAPSSFDPCPMCGAKQRRSFFARLLGR